MGVAGTLATMRLPRRSEAEGASSPATRVLAAGDASATGDDRDGRRPGWRGDAGGHAVVPPGMCSPLALDARPCCRRCDRAQGTASGEGGRDSEGDGGRPG